MSAAASSFFDDFNAAAGVQKDMQEAMSHVGKLLETQAVSVSTGTDPSSSASYDSAHAAFREGMLSIMAEPGMSETAILALPEDHPMRNYLVCMSDLAAFKTVLQPFITSHACAMEGDSKQVWEAEAAEGDGDEDYAQE